MNIVYLYTMRSSCKNVILKNNNKVRRCRYARGNGRGWVAVRRGNIRPRHTVHCSCLEITWTKWFLRAGHARLSEQKKYEILAQAGLKAGGKAIRSAAYLFSFFSVLSLCPGLTPRRFLLAVLRVSRLHFLWRGVTILSNALLPTRLFFLLPSLWFKHPVSSAHYPHFQ
jgi:hypothetical protein